MNQDKFHRMWNVMKEHELEIEDAADSEYKCTICKKIMINASIAPCGCQFCFDCIRQCLTEGNRKCPGQTQLCNIHRIDIDTDIRVDGLINTQISRLSVKCPNIGCQSKVELSTIVDHLRICENHSARRREKKSGRVQDHSSTRNCGHSKWIINGMIDNRDGIESLRRDVDKFRTQNEELKEKLKSDREKPQNKFYNGVLLLSIGLVFLALLCGGIFQMVFEHQAQQISRFGVIVENQNEEINKFKTKIDNLNIEIVKLRQRCQLTISRFDKPRHQLDESLIESDVIQQAGVTEESTGTPESIPISDGIARISIDGQFEWIIDNWWKKVFNNREIISIPLQTHPKGSRICLVVYPSVFFFYFGFRIISGQYDEVLRWPFDRVVEFSSINPANGDVYKTYNLNSSDFPNSTQLQKPQYREINKPFYSYFNIPHFYSIGMLLDNQMIIRFTSKPFEV